MIREIISNCFPSCHPGNDYSFVYYSPYEDNNLYGLITI